MPQLTIYLDQETQALLDGAVSRSGQSKSGWIASAIRARAGAEWPREVVALAGAWKDLETAERLRATKGKDIRRERL